MAVVSQQEHHEEEGDQAPYSDLLAHSFHTLAIMGLLPLTDTGKIFGVIFVSDMTGKKGGMN